MLKNDYFLLRRKIFSLLKYKRQVKLLKKYNLLIYFFFKYVKDLGLQYYYLNPFLFLKTVLVCILIYKLKLFSKIKVKYLYETYNIFLIFDLIAKYLKFEKNFRKLRQFDLYKIKFFRNCLNIFLYRKNIYRSKKNKLKNISNLLIFFNLFFFDRYIFFLYKLIYSTWILNLCNHNILWLHKFNGILQYNINLYSRRLIFTNRIIKYFYFKKYMIRSKKLKFTFFKIPFKCNVIKK